MARGRDEARRDQRTDVQFRAAAYAAGGIIALDVLTISARGLMARTDDDIVRADDPIRIDLPGLDETPGVIRWARDGMIGVEFDALLPLPAYLAMLGAVLDRQPDRNSDTPWSRSNR